MAEVQTNTQSGELSQRFIEFVLMQAQNAALFLGQIPNPQTGEAETNLDLARLFIDQLAMIQEKTRGNLSGEEANVLRSTLANLQMAYVEVSKHAGDHRGLADDTKSAPPAATTGPVQSTEASDKSTAPANPSLTQDGESKKKFSKSYGS